MTPLLSGHLPVMREQAVELLGCRAGGLYVDATLGGGGYAEAILQASTPDGTVLGLDWDAEAIDRVRQRLEGFGARLLLEQASFADLAQVLDDRGLGQVDGIAVDLGVSSYQLDDPQRGFSFLRDGPLDMRMDQGHETTAADLVNTLPTEQLVRLIQELGEEKWARRIARAIVSRRELTPFTRTRDLADLIERAVPKTRDSRRIHPATRSFQALRLAVNQELEALERFLARVLDLLKPGGHLCIVSFHSLEDRIVKRQFRDWARSCRCPSTVLPCQCSGQPFARLLTRKALRPTEAEIADNSRARSARLRAIEKVFPPYELL